MNNFLSIVWYKVLPPEYGGQKGIAQFNQYLGQKVALSCLCSRNNSPDENINYKLLNILPVSKLQFWNPFVRSEVLTLLRRQQFTHVIIEHPWHGWLGRYKSKYRFRFIVHAHNIEHLRFKAENKAWWRLPRSTEKKAFELADHILFKTENDRDMAADLFGISRDKCLIVPYGTQLKLQPARDDNATKKLRQQLGIDPIERLILFAGTPGYLPNIEALKIAVNNILPQLRNKGFRFKLVVCGQLPKERIEWLSGFPDIVAAGFVPDINEYMRSADVFINPVMEGSGIQTKNIDAIAQGCNVVATEFASIGLPRYLFQKKLFIAPDHDWAAFADRIIQASTYFDSTPQIFYEDYNWENIVSRLMTMISSSDF